LLGFNAVWLFYLIIVISALCLFAYLRYGLRDLLQFTLGGMFKIRYHIDKRALAEFPAEGGVLLLGNHVSWIDWALIQAVIPRPIRFVIDRKFYQHWLLHGLLKHLRTVPISPRRSKDAIKQISDALHAGDVVCLFPEGHISHDGTLQAFKAGYELALRNTEATVIAFYIHGMHGSRFSRVNQPRSLIGEILSGKRRIITVLIGEPTFHLTAAELQEEVITLRDSMN
jgi:acyl-[acyl-carrier-protein]-phospholipid O-acyltransferase/long-chain-fatty-acid--[acyl-carrier-protein] ligase